MGLRISRGACPETTVTPIYANVIEAATASPATRPRRGKRQQMSERFFAVCLIGLGIATMLGGLAVAAKCRDQASTCCISFAGVGLVCRD